VNQNLERTLTNYVDLKYVDMWSSPLVREKKQELKQRCIYYRIVKKGSILTYLTFHTVTIMAVMMSAVLRKSLISVLYVIVLLPHLRTAAEVMTMRLFTQE
jgi:hypothetical protein